MEVRFWHYDRRAHKNSRGDQKLLNSAGMFVRDDSEDRARSRQMIARFIFSLLKQEEELVVLEPINPENRKAFIQHMEELHKEAKIPLGIKKPRSLIARLLRVASLKEWLGKGRYDYLNFVCQTPEEMEMLISRMKNYMFYCITKKKESQFDIVLDRRKGYRRVKEGQKNESITIGNNLWIIVNPKDGAVEIQSKQLYCQLDYDRATSRSVATIRISREPFADTQEKRDSLC